LIPDAFIERLRDASDIESVISSYISLKRRGRTLTGLCPFHSEKTPSFTVYPDSASFYCFGCQKGGSVFTFVQEIERLDFVESVKLLAGRAGMPVPEQTGDDGASKRRARILEINRASARFFHDCLIGEQGREAYGYFVGRGLTRKTIRSFGLGFAPKSWDTLSKHLLAAGFTQQELLDAAVSSRGKSGQVYDKFRGRAIFPIMDLRANVIGFGARSLGEDSGPKYLNSADTVVFKKSQVLYALGLAKSAKSDMLILAEGYMDVIALHQAGFTSAIATLGTALTKEQALLISRYTGRVVLAYDNDSAGQNAARKAISLFSGLDVAVSVLDLGGSKDPDEYIKQHGAIRLQNLIEGGKSAIEFETLRLQKKHDLQTPEGKTAFLNEFCALMADIGSEIARDVHISQIARQLDVSKDGLVAATGAMRKKKIGAAKRKQAGKLRPFVQESTDAGAKKTGQHTGVELGRITAERALLALLMQNPDYYGEIASRLTEKDFAHPDHAILYKVMRDQLDENKEPDLALMSAHLDPKQMALASGLIAAGRDIKYYPQQAEEFLAAINRQKGDKSPEEIKQMSAWELQEYIRTQRATKK